MKHKFVEQSAMAVVLCGNLILTTKELIYGKEILSLPKGHIEGNESNIETAIRECFEEASLELNKNDFVKELKPFSYEFIDHNDKLISKTICPVLFRVNEAPKLTPKEKNVLEVNWIDIEEFYKITSYDNVRVILKEVLEGGMLNV